MSEKLPLRDASESVGWLNSVGPLATSPQPPQPCSFPRCPAVVVDGKTFCPVHSPDQVIARARAIVLNNFNPLVAASRPGMAEALTKLRDDIIHDLAETV